jgi:HD-like signal output (HDOD) protein
MLTEEGPLPESESFIRELGFGGADAPYPADLTALGSEGDEDEAPEQMNTLDITGIFDDFLADDDDPFEELHGSTALHALGSAPSSFAEADLAEEPPPIDEEPPVHEEPRLPNLAAAEAPRPAEKDEPSEQAADRAESAPAQATDDSLIDSPPPELGDSILRFSSDDLPLDEFEDSLTESAHLELQPDNPIVDSGLIEDAAPSIIDSSLGDTGTALDAPEPPEGTDEETDEEDALNEEDSARVLSNRGKALWQNQRARGSSREGKPPADIWDEAGTRASIGKDLRRDAERSKDKYFRALLFHLSDEIESHNVDLPPFPSAARRLLGRVSEEDVVEIIRSSPALAGNVVKVANSPYYMSAKPVTSLKAAFMRIGLDQARRVSLASLVGSSYEVNGFDRIMSRIQLHSIAAASVAEMIAPFTQLPKEEAFLGGLLHDAGMVLTYRLMSSANKATGDAWLVDQGTLRRMARKYHQRLGALFLSGWDLPGSVATMIAFHHHPDEAAEEFQPHAKCIHIADALAERAVTHSKDPKWRRAVASRNPDASEEERARSADIDGVNDISVQDLIFQAPPKLDLTAMHGVIRSVLLKLDSRRPEDGSEGDDEDASATSPGA